MNPVERSLQRLVAVSVAPPADDTPLDQLLLQAEVIATERQHILDELNALLVAGGQLCRSDKELLDRVLQIDARWQGRLAEARARLHETCERAERPIGRVSGYRAR